MRNVRFSVAPARAGRIYFIGPEDVQVVLGRLPTELWQRLRSVHFNDRGIGFRRLGYVGANRRDIALCAMPERLSLAVFCRQYSLSPAEFGAPPAPKWPPLAVRRFVLYEVFLHELGHLQVRQRGKAGKRLQFCKEKLAEEFAATWRRRLWSVPFDHADPVHNPPGDAG